MLLLLLMWSQLGGASVLSQAPTDQGECGQRAVCAHCAGVAELALEEYAVGMRFAACNSRVVSACARVCTQVHVVA
jgi:hypothetical protein